MTVRPTTRIPSLLVAVTMVSLTLIPAGRMAAGALASNGASAFQSTCGILARPPLLNEQVSGDGHYVFGTNGHAEIVCIAPYPETAPATAQVMAGIPCGNTYIGFGTGELIVKPSGIVELHCHVQ